MEHYVSVSKQGEVCNICGAPATHKVEETLPSVYELGGIDTIEEIHKVLDQIQRHPYTAYICCLHFALIMGPSAAKWCGVDDHVADN
jgi:hypothetical protein